MLASKVEGNKHVLHMERTTACLLATVSHGSLRNTTLLKVFKHSSEDRPNKRKHCTSNDVLSILAMLFFGGNGDYELTLSYYAISLWNAFQADWK